MMRIYIAGPYSAESEDAIRANVRAAIDAAITLVRKGHAPYIPHLTHFVDERSREVGANLTWEDYLEWDLAWLRVCDAFLYLGSSRGADLELAAAEKSGMRIYRSLDDIEPASLAKAKDLPG